MRPARLKDFCGQKEVKQRLEMLINLGKKRNQSIPHILFYGFPGTGKTTLANIVANEQAGKKAIYTNGGVIKTKEDIIKLVYKLDELDHPECEDYTKKYDSKSVMFIDEIHRISLEMAEELYSIMEDFKLSIMTGNNIETVPLPRFTLIGATTELGLMSKPLRDRFEKHIELRPYNLEEIKEIIEGYTEKRNVKIDDYALTEIAKRSRSTPRIAINHTKECIDVAEYLDSDINKDITQEVFRSLEIDQLGLTRLDRRYLNLVKDRPRGLNTLAQTLMENKDTLGKVVEPYLAQLGLIEFTSRGRCLSLAGEKYLNSKQTRGLIKLD